MVVEAEQIRSRWWCSGCGFGSQHEYCRRGDYYAGERNRGGYPCRWCLSGTGKCHNCRRVANLRRAPKRITESKTHSTLGDTDTFVGLKHHATGIPELDRVLNGGPVDGKVIMVAGTRGSGKTRLFLMVADLFANAKRPVLFCSGEDAIDHVKTFAQELRIKNDHIALNCNAEILDIDEILREAKEKRVKLLVIDSLQTLYAQDSGGDIGKNAMIEVVINRLTAWAKKSGIPVILLCQLNGQGDYAGGEKAQHLVDALLRIDQTPIEDLGAEGKLLRKLWLDGKSRIGPASTVAWMVMDEDDGGRLRSPSPHIALKLARLSV